MRALKMIIILLLIIIFAIVSAFIINVIGSIGREGMTLYHLTAYNKDTNEMLVDWESHYIEVRDEEDYIEFYAIDDRGNVSFRHYIKENTNIEYELTETKEKIK